MRKILVFLILSLLMTANSIADENHFKEFNKWLVQNEFKDYYKLAFAEPTGKCKDLEKFSHLWYYNKCDKQKKLQLIMMLTPIMVAQKFLKRVLSLITKLYFITIGIIRTVIGLIRQNTAS